MRDNRQYMTVRPSHVATEYKNITIGLKEKTLVDFEAYAKQFDMNNSAFGRKLITLGLATPELIQKLLSSHRTG